MFVKRSLPALLFFAAALTACKRTPAPTPARPAAKPTPILDISRLSDAQLVAANQQDGLALGLRIAGETYQVNKPIPLHILIEDLAARIPIASGLCSGIFLTYEDATTHESSRSQLSANPRCSDGDPYPDAIPLEKSKLKVLDLTTAAASSLDMPPGKYLLRVEWQSYAAGAGGITAPDTYSTLDSNAILITITP
jgi:hypothetical protein